MHVTTEPLPNPEQLKALLELVARALVEARNLASQEAPYHQIEDLADAFHNIPLEVFGWGGWSRCKARNMIAGYAEKYGREGYLVEFDRIFESQS